MTFLFTPMWLLLGLCLSFCVQAQEINLPQVQSQYLYQATNQGAPILKITYEEGKAQFYSSEGAVAFSQENLTQLLADHQRTHSPARRLLAAAVRLQAPADLPIQYFNDLFFWLRIGGCTTLYLGVVEKFKPEEVKYLSIPIAPFVFDEKIYEEVAAAQKVHPNTSFLSASFDWNWYFEEIKNQPTAYVPSIINPVVLDKGNMSFGKEMVNPQLLSILVQNYLALQYKNSYKKATPDQYSSILLNLDEQATYQDFASITNYVLEGYHVYWEELAFGKYQKTYLELEPAERWEVQQAAPLLILYYDELQAQEVSSLYELTPALWSEIRQ